MLLPNGECPDDPYCRARPIVKLNKTLYGIKQANREHFEEVFDFIVDDLGLQASIAAPCVFFGGTLGKANGVLIPVYVYDMMIIGNLTLISSIVPWLYDRFKAAGCVPVPDTFQYLGMTVTRSRSKRSIAIQHVGYINLILDRFAMASCRKRSMPLEVGHKPQAIQADEQPFDTGMYQKPLGSILYAALGTQPDITYAISVLRRYAAQPSTLHWEAIKHLLRYLPGTCEYQLTIYDPSHQPDLNSIVCYASADLGREADISNSTLRTIMFALGILVPWTSKKQTVVAQSTIHAVMIARAYGEVQLNWLRDVISEIELGANMTRHIFNDGLNGVATLHLDKLQSESRHI